MISGVVVWIQPLDLTPHTIASRGGQRKGFDTGLEWSAGCFALTSLQTELLAVAANDNGGR